MTTANDCENAADKLLKKLINGYFELNMFVWKLFLYQMTMCGTITKSDEQRISILHFPLALQSFLDHFGSGLQLQ